MYIQQLRVNIDNPIDYYIDQTPSGKRTRADWVWVSKLPLREKIVFGTILLQEKTTNKFKTRS